MKKIVMCVVALGALISSACSLAANVGTVDMQAVFESSGQVKAIHEKIESQFRDRTQKIVASSQALQAKMEKLQKNKAVMDQKTFEKKQEALMKEGADLRQKQAALQKDMMVAQNEKMTAFIKQVKSAVQRVANKKHIDLVMVDNAVVYAKDQLDLTKEVLTALR